MAHPVTTIKTPVQNRLRNEPLRFLRFANALKAHYDIKGIPSYVEVAISVLRNGRSLNMKIIKDTSYLSNVHQKIIELKVQEYVPKPKLSLVPSPETSPRGDRPTLQALQTDIDPRSADIQFRKACEQQQAFFMQIEMESKENGSEGISSPSESKANKAESSDQD